MRSRRHDGLPYVAATVGAAAVAIWWWMRGRYLHGRERAAAIAPLEPSHAWVPYAETALPAAAAGAGVMHSPTAASRPIAMRGFKWTGPALALLVAAIAGGLAYREHRVQREVELTVGGVGERAIPVMLANGCAGCHTIPGVPSAQGQVGPRLDATLSSRLYIAGVLPNNKENMICWLRASRQMVPHTTMPSTGISEQQARDVAAYLYAIR
jgi:cytochrome c1